MNKSIYILFSLLLFISCKKQQETNNEEINTNKNSKIEYAKGFDISYQEGYKVITLKNAWPGTEKVFKYALIEEATILDFPEQYDAIVTIPIKNIVVTSTTHIPSLEMLAVDQTLIGFPNLDYISSKKTRERINKGLIKELGKNEDINTESLIELSPDVVIGFAVDGNNKTFNTLKKTGIPVLYNGDWTETSPLGKAEWIKFFAAFYNKEALANKLFSEIKTAYLNAKKLALKAKNKPTVLSGAMYKDIWYLPQGKSWAAQFIADANGKYLWSDSKGTGSHSLNLESVLEKGEHAQFWIGPSYYTTMKQLKEAHAIYKQFDAFKNDQVYSFTHKVGDTGGLLYFELAPNRPDIILKDIIKILHPELLPNHNLYFFDQLK
ncbi:MAG: ABC transporter substrate-binding protein [Flavobacteriaceae bacterium]|jgi:iron complex transport system substrate-binding protein|nr:ABC transporter substrate-binding protein [Flavobacteriaceae bacterium]MBT6704671.1 ABC transporter substrate-binding protein [Flavobacteriaceae bacterium]